MQPNTCEDWLTVLDERQADARALLPDRKTSTGPVYMAGYAIEAGLKAFLRKNNKPFPRSGGEGHNLRELWRQAGFKLSDMKDESGEKAFFIENWKTDLRYETSLEQVSAHKHDSEPLVEAACKLAGWIRAQARRNKRGRSNR